MDDQSLVPTKRSYIQDANWDIMNNKNFIINDISMASETGGFVEKHNTILKNNTSSTIRESSVITKTIIRKKTMMLNGEIVEQEEEETEETNPSCREMTTQSQSFYADQDLFQGSSMNNSIISPNINELKLGGFQNTNSKWKSIDSSNNDYPQLKSNFDLISSNGNQERLGMDKQSFFNRISSNGMQRKMEQMDMDGSMSKQILTQSKLGSFDMQSNLRKMEMNKDPFFDISTSNEMGTDSMTFRSANIRSVERMTAFQSSINGKVNPPVVNMDKNTIFYDSAAASDDKIKQVGFPETGNKGNKLLALPESENKDKSGKKKSVLTRLGFRKKKEDTMKDNVRVRKIIEELITTEENYIGDLSKVVDVYKVELERPDAPRELVEDQYGLFGNIEHIYMFHDVQFHTDLLECDKSPTDIANCFLKHSREFALYRHYNRNKPSTEAKLSKYESFFTEKSKQINDIQSLASYLIKPTQRIGRYILLLREIAKECKKCKVSTKELNDAIIMLETEIKFGNDLMALDALKGLPPDLDIKAQGDLIYRDKFTVIPPGKGTKYEAMIFLFKERIVISDVQLENNTDTHYYKDNIPLTEIGITECNNEPKIFKIWYLKHNNKNYTLQTKPEIKKLWIAEIRKTLENELNKMKEQSSRNSGRETTMIDLNEMKYIDINLSVKKK